MTVGKKKISLPTGVLQTHKWENAFTIDKQSWGYRKNIDLNQVLTIEQIIKEFVTSVSCGGKLARVGKYLSTPKAWMMNKKANTEGVPGWDKIDNIRN